jgi:hypothetical protein
MRKTFALRFYQQSGGNLLERQRALGHKWVSTTQQYIDINDAEIDAVILAMESRRSLDFPRDPEEEEPWGRMTF